ncbi:hypothetical protein HYR53_04285 [Candidatus Acetothermia bacterium]|nr:hypothetical protein [Candidatus Acetothermia bacterium]
MSRNLLVYIDSLNRKSGKIEPADFPSGYIEQMADESIEETAQAARESFGLRADQGLRLRAISDKEFEKIQKQEGQAQETHVKHFETIFEKSGAEPGKWLKIKDGETSPKDEETKKKLEKKLFR